MTTGDYSRPQSTKLADGLGVGDGAAADADNCEHRPGSNWPIAPWYHNHDARLSVFLDSIAMIMAVRTIAILTFTLPIDTWST